MMKNKISSENKVIINNLVIELGKVSHETLGIPGRGFEAVRPNVIGHFRSDFEHKRSNDWIIL